MFVKALGSIVGLFLLVASTASLFSSGAPEMRTGAPGDIGTCNSSGCHNSFPVNSGSGSVTISGPQMYIPGETLDFTVRVAEEAATRFGFEITAKDLSDTNTGIWDVSDPLIQFASQNPDYVTHGPAQSASREFTWNVRWTAPVNDRGEIRFYAAGNAANGNNNAKGDRIYTAMHSLLPASDTASEIVDVPSRLKIVSVFPKPFVSRASVSYVLDTTTDVSLDLFDMTGRQIESKSMGTQAPGMYELLIHADDMPSGLILFRLRAGNTFRTGTLVLAK